MNTLNCALSLIAVFSLWGCSVQKDMKQAEKSTREVKEATLRLEELTRSVEESSGQIYEDGREAGTVNLLRESFNQMLKGDRHQVVRKIEYATIYMSSFEFQFWRGRRGDTEEVRQILMAKAVDLFFAEIDDLIDEKFPLSVLNPYSVAFQNWLNLSVLAFAMDRVHDRQTLLARERGYKPYSLLELILEGLEYKTLAQKGTAIPEFANKVLQREQQALYLLQLRQNFLPFVVLGLITDFDEGLWPMVKHVIFPRTLDFSWANQKQIEFWNDLMTRAQQTRAWLHFHGIEPKANPILRQAIRQIRDFEPPQDQALHIQQQSQRLIQFFNNLRN